MGVRYDSQSFEEYHLLIAKFSHCFTFFRIFWTWDQNVKHSKKRSSTNRGQLNSRQSSLLKLQMKLTLKMVHISVPDFQLSKISAQIRKIKVFFLFFRMSDPVILSYHDSVLRQSDLVLLERPNWLNDNIIAFAFQYFQEVFSFN